MVLLSPWRNTPRRRTLRCAGTTGVLRWGTPPPLLPPAGRRSFWCRGVGLWKDGDVAQHRRCAGHVAQVVWRTRKDARAPPKSRLPC